MLCIVVFVVCFVYPSVVRLFFKFNLGWYVQDFNSLYTLCKAALFVNKVSFKKFAMFS